MNETSPHEPVASRFTLSASRWISLPKRFCTKPKPPYWLFEVTPLEGETDWLHFGFCHAVALPHLQTEYGTRLQVVGEYHSSRLTLPAALCEKYALIPGGHGWLVSYGHTLEVWAESVWNREVSRSLAEFLDSPA